jgi:ribosomal-protein-alanine N-acetyltransferase
MTATLALAPTLAALPALETERLVLRRLTMADAPAVFAYASDPAIGKHTAWPPHATLADSEAYLRMALTLYEGGNEALWGIVSKEEGQVVGTCGLYDIDLRHGTAALGYVLALRLRGRGLMPEAMRAVLGWAFGPLGLHRVQGVCRVDNDPSTRVMEKLGLRPEGVMRGCRVVKGTRIDMKMYAILAPEFRV